MRGLRFARRWLVLTVAVVVSFLGWAQAQHIHRNGFEGREPVWIKGSADANFQEILHDITDLTARTGQRSEHLQINAEQGSFIYYLYPTQGALLTEDLSARVWIRSTRPGLQLLARLVLPQERDPKKPDVPLTTLLRGDQYQIVGRWQPLELRQPLKLANEQQQLLRLEMRRDINFAGAYIDCLYLNVYGGPGRTEVWMDDLEIGPVLEDVASPATSPGSAAPSTLTGSKEPGRPLKGRRASAVEMNQDRLLVNGKRFFMRAIRHSDTPLSALRDAGFNTVYFDSATPQALVDQAVDLGFWVVPALPVVGRDGHQASAETLMTEVQKFLLTYIALSAGYRGLGFWSDRFLADSHQGRDRLLTLALLNQELLLLEPLLVSAKEPLWRNTSIPEVKAAIFHTDRGVLVLPIWLGQGAQFVPGQSTTPKLTIVVPETPLGTQPWQITPVEVRSLEQERVVGGTKVTIPEFSLTTAILFTADNSPTGVLVYLQDRVRHQREMAAQWARDLAQVELEKVTRINEQLEAAGHPLPDGTKLLHDARSRFQQCLQ